MFEIGPAALEVTEGFQMRSPNFYASFDIFGTRYNFLHIFCQKIEQQKNMFCCYHNKVWLISLTYNCLQELRCSL